MRKSVSILLVVVILLGCCLISLSACKKDKFEYVKSITITTSGETKTFSSTVSLVKKSSKTISKEEYDSAPSYLKESIPLPSRVKLPPKNQLGCTVYFEPFETEQTRYYYRYNFVLIYEKNVYTGINYNYVQVKVIDNTTIAIKNSTGTTTYTVTSYKIIPLEK